jgi:NADPH:quinone reductase-like Zn-dependent oxidoreductase
MQAMVQERYGEAEDVLHLATIDRPKIGDGDVLVRVHAAGVDRGVWHLTAGLPYPVRLISGLRTPKARVPGTDDLYNTNSVVEVAASFLDAPVMLTWRD